jgi:hypothetical protein
MKNKFGLFLYKILIFAMPVFALFEILFRLGFTPVITNSTLFDFKMSEVQKHPIHNPRILAIGSSITLYELNSATMVKNFGGSYYNFASWDLQIGDMRVLLNEFVKEYEPKYVLVCSSIADFISPRNESYLNYLNTNRYIRNHFPEFFYFKGYNSIHQIIRRKYKAYRADFDPWGGASLTIQPKDINLDKWNEHDIFPTKYTKGQYDDLDSLGAWLKQQHVEFIFAQAPIKASYTNTLLSKQIIESHFDKCKSIVEAHGGVYLNYCNTTIFTDSLFFDQYHLQAAGGAILTNEIVTALKGIIK